MPLEVLFFVTLFLLFWIYIGYPVFLFVLTLFIDRKFIADPLYLPSVSIVILTYNEEKVIGEKITNTLRLDYPKDKLDIMVVDSNSSDATQRIVREFESSGVRLFVQEKREGKASAVHFGIQQAKGEIIICTDANADFASDVLKKIVPYFADEKVGGVAGAMTQIDKSKTATSSGGSFYWKMEKIMRISESKLHSVIGMSGEICSFRRAIFQGVRLEDWYKKGEADDFSLSLYIITKGYRIAYASDASVHEPAPDNISDLFKQKVKTVTMTIQTLFGRPSLISFQYGLYSTIILPSRKILPLLSPFLLIFLFVTTRLLYSESLFFEVFFYLQIAVGVLALLSSFVKKRIFILPILQYFLLLNVITLNAWFNFISGKDFTIWDQVKSTR